MNEVARGISADGRAPAFAVECDQPFLIARFPGVCDTLGWSLTRPGFARTSLVAWLEVRNADLTPDVDPLALLREKLAGRGLEEAAAFMTSRDVRRHHLASAEVEGIAATCLATVGLTNGEAVGARRKDFASVGTINSLVHVSRPMTQTALIETISIVAEARTAAILETAHLRSGPRITGTGTDCILVAAPVGPDPETCAGLHTALGEAVGSAVYRAIREGAEAWAEEMEPQLRSRQASQRDGRARREPLR